MKLSKVIFGTLSLNLLMFLSLISVTVSANQVQPVIPAETAVIPVENNVIAQTTLPGASSSIWYNHIGLMIDGGYGFTQTIGKVIGDGGQKRNLDQAGSFGISAFYRFNEYHNVYTGLDVINKTFNVERLCVGLPQQYVLNATFINYIIVYRFMYKYFYADGGAFYGFKFDTFEERYTYNGVTTVTKLRDEKAKWCHDEAGLYAGIGVAYTYKDLMTFTLGVYDEISFKKAFIHDDELSSNVVIFKLGYTFFIKD